MRPTIAVPILLLACLFAGGSTKRPVPEKLQVMHVNHYRIHTDLDRSLADDLARRMDAMYEEYSRRLATFAVDQSSDRYDVYLFARRKAYLAFTFNEMSNAGGVAMPDERIVVADLENNGRDGLRRCLQHEAFHLFAHSVIHPDLPPWLNEGLAVMFEEGIWTGRTFLLGQAPPRRVRQLKHDIANKRIVDFRTIMRLNLEQWNKQLDSDRAAGALNYNQAWAMCHFLVYATENGKAKYRPHFLDLLRRIRGGTKPMDAFMQAFSPNIEGFQARFLQWTKTLEPTPDATAIERQNVLADMLIHLRRGGQRFDDIEDFRARLIRGGQIEYSSGDLKWVSESDPRVYFRTIDGRTYNRSEMYFDTRSGAPIPDLVCSPIGQIKLRTRFYDQPKGQIEHETLVEGGANGR